jgi:methylphosphotriester-DNA--protein-cysteine methyltransferase
MEKIFKVEKACPLCNGDVYGNDNLRYYCKRCNLLFKKNELRIGEELVASKNSKRFHLLSCVSVRNLKEENKVFFKTREEALKNNFTPCRVCLKEEDNKNKK